MQLSCAAMVVTTAVFFFFLVLYVGVIQVLAELRDLKSDINELGRSLNGSSCALRPAGLNGRRKAGGHR